MYAVAGPAVSAAPSPSAVPVFELPRKRKRVMDPAEWALMWGSFQS